MPWGPSLGLELHSYPCWGTILTPHPPVGCEMQEIPQMNKTEHKAAQKTGWHFGISLMLLSFPYHQFLILEWLMSKHLQDKQ